MPAAKKLKVAFVYDDSLDGSEGVAQYVKIMGTWMSQRGHVVSYFVGETKIKSWHDGPVHSLAKNVKVTFNANKLSIPLPAKLSNIKAAIVQEQPDVLHVQLPDSPFMAQKVVSAAKTSAAVGTFHIYPSGWLAKSGSRLLKVAYFGQLKKFQKIVSVSRAAQSFAADYYGIKTEILPNVVELKTYKSATVKNAPGRIVFLGRLVNRKGCRQLIQAFRLVKDAVADAELIIAGDGPERQALEELVAKLGLRDSVQFRGFIDEADKPSLLASATIACFPSLYGESFGLVLIEAMAAGAGVVLAGNNPGYASVMEDKPEVLFDPNQKDQLAASLIRLLKDDSARQKLHTWQKQLVKKYDVENVGPQLEEIYYQAVANKGISGHN